MHLTKIEGEPPTPATVSHMEQHSLDGLGGGGSKNSEKHADEELR